MKKELKDFLTPTWGKIIIAIILFLMILSAISFIQVLFEKGGGCNPVGCTSYEQANVMNASTGECVCIPRQEAEILWQEEKRAENIKTIFMILGNLMVSYFISCLVFRKKS